MNIRSMFLASSKFNSPGDYIRFRNTRSYVLQKHTLYFAGLVGKSRKEKLKHLYKQCGYSDYAKFVRRLGQWVSLSVPIPRKYFDEIGIDYHVLDFVVELDNEEYANALNTQFLIENFEERIMAGIYLPISLPGKMTEPEAIDYIRSFQRETKFRCCINVTGLKSIYVEPDGTVKYEYLKPVMTTTKDLFVFSTDNKDNAVTKLL
jgi:hypothetical protein